MSLADELQTGVAEVFGVLGKSASYNGTGISIVVERYSQNVEQSPGLTLADAVIYVRGLDVPNPKKKDTVTWDGTAYLVVSVLEGDGQGLTWKLACNKKAVQ